MLTLVIFILILSVLVLVHEFGHFIVAKKSGVKVEEFGLGIPPKIIGKKIGETIYSLNLLPFGGFVRLLGEDDTEVVLSSDSRNFASKTPFQRIAILVAGVTMNTLLGMLLFYIILISNGFKSLNLPLIFDYKFRFGEQIATNTVVMSFMEGSAAESGGINSGDAVLEINDQPVYNVSDIRALLKDKVGQKVKVLVKDMRDNSNLSIRTLYITPTADEKGDGILGAYLTKSIVLSYQHPVEKLLAGPLHAYNMVAYSVNSFKKLIGLSVVEKSVEPVSAGIAGPVGIYKVVGGILDYTKGSVVLSLLDLIALMSVSLALLNIMPFPALDGGRVFFIVIEKLRGGKKVNPSFEANVHKWGMLLLLGLIVLITIKDIAGFSR